MAAGGFPYKTTQHGSYKLTSSTVDIRSDIEFVPRSFKSTTRDTPQELQRICSSCCKARAAPTGDGEDSPLRCC